MVQLKFQFDKSYEIYNFLNFESLSCNYMQAIVGFCNILRIQANSLATFVFSTDQKTVMPNQLPFNGHNGGVLSIDVGNLSFLRALEKC